MRPLIHAALRNLLHHLPRRLLSAMVRRRRTLGNHLPKGFTLRWPYYLDDVSVLVQCGNAIEWPMFLGEYEEDISQVVGDFVRPGHHCIDVGANVGPVTLLLAKQIGPLGRLAAVEPGPPYRERLIENLRMNPHLSERVTVVAAGLADAPGTLHWQADPNAPFNAWLHDAKPWGETGSAVPVPVETLDALVDRLGWPTVDFLKIDVEGMEWEVLKGGRDTLAKHQPVVVFEALEIMRTYRRNVSGVDIFAEIAGLLTSLGYATYLPPSPDKPLEDRSADRLPNIVAIPAGIAVPVGYCPHSLA